MNEESWLERWWAKLMLGLEGLLGLAFLCAILLNCLNVIGRYGLGRTFMWAEDVQVFILVWMVFLGAAIASFRNTHVRMDLLARALPAPARRVLDVLEAWVAFALFSFVAWLSHDYLRRIVELDQTTDIGGLPVWIAHAAVAVSFGLMALTALVRGVASGLRVYGRRPRREQPI